MFKFNNFLKDENAAGVVEMILIIVVLISLVLIFKTQLTTFCLLYTSDAADE